MIVNSRFIAATWLFAFLPAANPVQAEEHMHHHAMADMRQEIVLSPEERAMVLTEMRQFLTGIQGITSALAQDDVKAVAPLAASLGMQAAHNMPAALRAKMPLGFRQMGMSLHQSFDQVAMDAESLGDAKHTLGQMGAVLQTCVACHGQFRLERAAANSTSN